MFKHIAVYGRIPGIDITDELLEEFLVNGYVATFYGPVKALSTDSADFLLDLNVTGSLSLLKAAEKAGISGVSLNPQAPDSFSIVDITNVDVYGSGNDNLTVMIRDFIKTGTLTARGVIAAASGKRGVMHKYNDSTASIEDRTSVSDEYNIVEQSDLARTIVNVMNSHQDGVINTTGFGANSKTVTLTEFCKALFEEVREYVLRCEVRSEETMIPQLRMPSAPLSRTSKVRTVKGVPDSNGESYASLSKGIRYAIKRLMEDEEMLFPNREDRYTPDAWLSSEPKLGMATSQSGKAYHGNGKVWYAPKTFSDFHKELDFH